MKEGSVSYSLFLTVFFQPGRGIEETDSFSNLWVTSTLLAGIYDYDYKSLLTDFHFAEFSFLTQDRETHTVHSIN